MEKVVSSSIKGKASDAVFFTLFFSAVYFLLLRWREKIRTSTPLHLVTLSEMAAIITFLASFIYLFGFLVQSLIVSPSGEDEEDEFEHLMVKEDSQAMPCGAQLELDHLKINNQKSDTDDLKIKTKKSESIIEEPLSEADEEIVKSVVEGKIPSYALESKLGDCRRAAAIRREALQRTTGKSLEGLPLEGFDYESILGQCCEMPVGYVQIVGRLICNLK